MSETSLAMLPWFPRDFLASTRAMRLAERGAYRELLDYQWEMGVLPADHDRLARLLGVGLDEFREIWPAIEGKFVAVAGGLQNQRLEEHRKKALEQRDKKRKGAEIANAKRGAVRPGERGAQHAAERSAKRLASDTPPSPSPSPSMEKEETHVRARAGAQVDLHEPFERWKAAYPTFAGRHDWLVVEAHYRTQLENGSTVDELQQAVERYAAYVAAGGASTTAHVLRPDTFLTASDQPWRQPWTPPVAIPRAKAAQPKFVPPKDEDEVAHA